jgi:DNA-binding protein
MNYVVACVTFFNQGVNNIVLKARGKAISKTVDTVELLKRAFVKDLVVQEINIGTELVERENLKSNVSTIEISIEKPSL